MPDITMCTGHECGMRDDCLRFKATPSRYNQSWFSEPPVFEIDGRTYCDYHVSTKFKIMDGQEMLLSSGHCWIEVENLSVHVKKNDDGVSVAFYSNDDGESISETWVLFNEA